MSHFDHLDLDGHLLGLLLAVAEEQSVTRAAQRLGLTQSAVSHALDKLRAIVGDALFVRSGRGIVPTARVEALVQQARLLLEQMRGFATAGGFDAGRFEGCITVAANDLQRDLLLPAWLRRLRAQAPGLVLRVIPSGVPTPEMLRDGACQLVLSPRPPEAADLVQKRLFEDRYAVFYDAEQRPAPAGLADYLAAEHVTVVYEPRRALDLDQWLVEQGVARRFVASVPGFAGVPAFVRGSAWLCTAPSRLSAGLLRGLASVAPPLPCPTMPMYAIWHVRHQADPLHQWLRRTLDEVAAGLVADEV
ncbi:LysR family transcriptional regulator [Ideonella sp. DXS22W]|uniref:LysR family transcriptional regulator n=2 Tax=Pseudaquabacterium inlustre TaxID=2984192 RepID=A0ABU9CKB8_9BURK